MATRPTDYYFSISGVYYKFDGDGWASTSSFEQKALDYSYNNFRLFDYDEKPFVEKESVHKTTVQTDTEENILEKQQVFMHVLSNPETNEVGKLDENDN